MAGLNEQQKRFVDEHLKLREKNGTQAAINAGYSRKTAAQQAYQLLHKTSVSEFLQQRKTQLYQDLRKEFLFDAIEAREVLYDIMNDPTAEDADRIRVARDFLDRAGFDTPGKDPYGQDSMPAEPDFSDVTPEELRKLASLVPDSSALVTKSPAAL